MEKIKTTSSLCMRCLQSIMTEEIKADNDCEFQFVEGVCNYCEDMTMVTSTYHYNKLEADVSDNKQLEAEYLIMRKAYQ
jgi:hypothetical protein